MRNYSARARARYSLLAGLTFACGQVWGIEDTTIDCVQPCALGGASGSNGSGGATSGQPNRTTATGARGGAASGGSSSGASAGISDGGVDAGRRGADGGATGGGGVESGAAPSGGAGGADGGADARGGNIGASGHAGEASGGAGASSWTPRELGGLMLWLDASVGVTEVDGAVLAWRDQSPAHHLAKSDAAFEGPGLDAKALAGLPAVSFDGVNDRLLVPDAESLHLGIDGFALALVVSSAPGADSPNDGRVLFSKQAEDWPSFQGVGVFLNAHRIFAYLAQPAVLESPVPGAPFYDDNRVRIVGVHRHANALDLRVNGAVVHTVQDTVSASAEGFPIRLGAGRADQYLNGLIAEVVLSRVDSSKDVEDIDHYLQEKYADALAIP